MNDAKRRQEKLLRNVLFTFFVTGAATLSLGSYIPQLRAAYDLSYRTSGLLLSAQSIGNLVATLLAGVLAGSVGRRKSILSLGLWLVVAHGIFAAGIGQPAVLLAAFFMTGIAKGGSGNFAATMISTLPAEKATRGYNLQHAGAAIGALLTPLILVGFTRLAPEAGWRRTSLVLGLLGVAQLAVYRGMRLPGETAGGTAVRDRSFLANPVFWSASAMIFCYIAAEYSIMGWLVTYFQDVGILSPRIAQLMNSLLWFVMFCGRVLGALMSDKISRRRLLLLDGIGFLLFFALLFSARTPAVAITGLIGSGMFMATIYPTAIAFGSDAIRDNDFGMGLMIFWGSLGGIVTLALVGFVSESYGIRAGMGFIIAIIGALLLTILASVFSRPGRKTA